MYILNKTQTTMSINQDRFNTECVDSRRPHPSIETNTKKAKARPPYNEDLAPCHYNHNPPLENCKICNKNYLINNKCCTTK